jgi:predicted ATP-dependent endonuclease of OLD family
MKLTIHNFAKIASAELQLDGMTVVCGDNNTGKSTAGKALVTLIELFKDLELKVIDARKDKYHSLLFNKSRVSRLEGINPENEKILERVMDGSLIGDELTAIVKKTLPESDNSEYVQSVVKRIMDVRVIPDAELKRQIAFNRFYDVFRMQHLPLEGSASADTELVLDSQSRWIKLAFKRRHADSLPVLDGDMDMHRHAFFIDTPDVLDKINDYWYLLSDHRGDLNNIVINALYSQIERERKNTNVIDDYLVNAKIKGIYEKITSTINGDSVVESEKLSFHEDDMRGNLEIGNLSKGMKAFALLQLLLKEHVLQEEDVLVLDEPEIHLHPAWQVFYAEILVLLQKSFNLTVLLTTHSSYFLEAIQLFSRKYQQEKSLHIYKSSVQSNDGMATLTEVDTNATDIYASFMMPLDSLQDLRNELKEKGRNE